MKHSEQAKISATLIYNVHLIDENLDTPGAVLIVGDKIRAVYTGYFTNKKTVTTLAQAVLLEDGYADCEVFFYDGKGLTLMPAFIDLHAHLRYPGQTEKEDLESGLGSAVAGGFGTVVAMPNTKPIVSTAESALDIEAAAESLGLANMFQTVSITKDFGGTDTSEIPNLPTEKIPVITEDGKDVESAAVMLEAMKEAAQAGIIVACHSEDNTLAAMAKPFRASALKLMREYHINSWGEYSESEEDLLEEEPQVIEEIENSLTQANDILETAEDIATMRNIELAKSARCHVHISHVSTAGAIEAIRKAKEDIAAKKAELSEFENFAAFSAFEMYDEYNAQRFLEGESAEELEDEELAEAFDLTQNFRVTCEVTPHHLALVGDSGRFLHALVNPPLRHENDRQALIEAIIDGTVDTISTDHAPHTKADKEAGAPGFVGFETAFAVCNTVLVENNQITSQKLSQLMSANAARILRLNKGTIAAGRDADLVLVDRKEVWQVNVADFKSKGRATPFAGTTFVGKVKATFVGGCCVFENI